MGQSVSPLNADDADESEKSKGQADIVGETGSLRFMDFLIAWLNGDSLLLHPNSYC